MIRQILATALLALFSSIPAMAQQATDYLGVPGPLTVGDTDYILSSSSQPSEGYFKQESSCADCRSSSTQRSWKGPL